MVLVAGRRRMVLVALAEELELHLSWQWGQHWWPQRRLCVEWGQQLLQKQAPAYQPGLGTGGETRYCHPWGGGVQGLCGLTWL